MRSILLVTFSFIVFGSSGCAGLIAGSGHDLRDFKTIDEVQTTFGDPKYLEETEYGQKAYYTTRKKIADTQSAYGYKLAAGMTAGLSDFVSLPFVLGDVAWDVIGGQTITFTFNKKGRVVDCTPEGYGLRLPLRAEHPEEDETKPDEPKAP